MRSLPPLLAACLLLLPAALRAEEEEPKTVLITAVKPERGSVPQTVVAYGTAATAPGRTVNISLSRSGQILEVHVLQGQAVHKGDKLVDFGVDASVMAGWDQAVATLTLAKEQRSHTAQLLAQQLATRTALAEADKAVADAQGAMEVLRREGGGKPSESVAAPFDGIVMNVAVNTGDRVAEKAALATIARADGMAITVGAEPSDRQKLKLGQPAELTPVDGGDKIKGTVTSVGAMVNAKSRLVDMVVTPAAGAPIIPGENYRAEVTVGQFEGWVLPRNAVQTDYDGPHVFQVQAEKAVRVGVTIVGMPGKTAVVDGPIDPDRKLVTIGNHQLADGVSVHEDDSQL
jgi:membrane fusion protein (multidrug efflux system)